MFLFSHTTATEIDQKTKQLPATGGSTIMQQALHCSMKVYFILVFIAIPILCSAQVDTLQHAVPGRRNSLIQQEKPYVILISSDGFRHDYATKYNATNLLALSKEGIRAKSMRPSFPSLTFPNHYAIATGLYPSHNGVVGNYYFDRARSARYGMSDDKAVSDGKRYGGVPLWVLAEQQSMLSASLFWVGSEADIRNTLPTYYYKYNEKFSIQKRIKIIVDWLRLPADIRPHLITFYMPETDHAGHDFGPDAQQTIDAVLFVDKAMKDLTAAVKATGLPVSFIFLADHGMSAINAADPIVIKTVIDTNNFTVIPGGQIYQIYAKDKKDVAALYKNLQVDQNRYTVFLKNNLPRRFHYREKDDWHQRIGDIVILPVWPNVFKYSDRRIKPGAHGFDPYKISDMHAIFYAWGNAFKKGLQVKTFDNVHVYPIITEILGLKNQEKIDGRKKVAKKILKP